MQIFQVAIVNEPAKGQLVIVGSGFRYYANDSSGQGTDKFTLQVFGKNRHDLGKSTLEIEVRSDANEVGRVFKRVAAISPDHP